MINPVADMLKIPRHRVYANNLLFKADGSFAGFDPEELTSRGTYLSPFTCVYDETKTCFPNL